jgi:hypothetical protein
LDEAPILAEGAAGATCAKVVFVSCDWYDIPTKVAPVRRLIERVRATRDKEGAKKRTHPLAFLAGGLGRLSTRRAQMLGGEAFELREALLTDGGGGTLAPEDVVVVTGLKNTGDNVDSLFTWLWATT